MDVSLLHTWGSCSKLSGGIVAFIVICKTLHSIERERDSHTHKENKNINISWGFKVVVC